MTRHASARTRRPRTTAAALAIVLVAIACMQAAASAGGPVRGGTLTLLGASDVYNLDTVSAYYAPNNLIERAYTRQLVTYRSLPSFPASSTLVPDVATQVPRRGNGISADGLVYTFTLRSGVQWSTSPPREVTADDFVREFKLLCNPASPVGAPGYFTSTIAGMAAYCAGFAKVAPTVPAIAAYVDGHTLAGVTARDPATLEFRLTKPAPDFLNILATAFASARPVEYMSYVPDSAELRQNTLSDGPYRITSYEPTKSLTLERNPAWLQAGDPVRHDYVDGIRITEGLTSQSVQQQIEAGTADMEWDLPPPTQDLHRLIAARDKRLIIAPPGPYYAALPYFLVLNHYKGPMTNPLVRQAVAAAVDKREILQIAGGPRIGAVADQMVLPGSVGFLASLTRYAGEGRRRRPRRREGVARARRLSPRIGDQAAHVRPPIPSRASPRRCSRASTAAASRSRSCARPRPTTTASTCFSRVRPSAISGISRCRAGSRTGSAATGARCCSPCSRRRDSARATSAATTTRSPIGSSTRR